MISTTETGGIVTVNYDGYEEAQIILNGSDPNSQPNGKLTLHNNSKNSAIILDDSVTIQGSEINFISREGTSHINNLGGIVAAYLENDPTETELPTVSEKTVVNFFNVSGLIQLWQNNNGTISRVF